MIEAGYPARVAGALERAEAAPGFHEEPTSRALSQILHAQMLLLDGMGAAAVRAALEGLGTLPPDTEGSPLAVIAHLTAAECLLASGDVTGATVYLDRVAGSPGRTGLLAARAEVLQARIGLARGTPGPEAIRAILDRALTRLGRLGALRDLALAYMTYAHAVAADEAGGAVNWLTRAQPLLAKAGTTGDLRQLRLAFRSFGRRKIDQIIDADVFSVVEALRERHARLRDILSAQRDARASGQLPLASLPSPLAKVVDESLESVHLAEEALIGVMEHTLLDRERISQLVAASQQLSSLENLGEILGAIPRLAMMLIPAAVVGLVEVDAAGELEYLPGGSALEASSFEHLRQSVVSALQAKTLHVITDEASVKQPLRSLERSAGGRYAVIPLQGAGRCLSLVVGMAEHQGPLFECDIEQLAVFGSLSSAAMTRASSSAALRQAAARDAATLAAIRDGILTLDQDRVVRALNHAALRLLRVGQEQVLGRRLQEVAALAPLGEMLRPGKPLTDEIVALAHGDLLVRSQPYEGGTIITLQELASVQRLAHKLVGSQARFSFEDLIGKDPAFLACLEDARLAARSDVPILITGESGTGKELLAQAIHRASRKAVFPFVGINVAAFPRELLESELFGYERGAFTGARAGGNPGKFELADQGTILLDEIGDMPLEMQVKLLRVLQERVFQRLGGSRDIPLLARVIATTHRDLEMAIGEGAFRLDLFHRLRVVHLRLPALRERRGDIPLLVGHHLQRYALRQGRRSIRVAPHVMAAFEAYDWPGNVRELANLLEGAASLLPDEQDVITRIPPVVERALQHRGAPTPRASSSTFLPMDRVLSFEEVERSAFEHALRHCAGNVAQAAKALGVAKGTFYSKIRRYGLMAQEHQEGMGGTAKRLPSRQEAR
ncbi:sigma-54 interaction domain-containing protein [Archangium sp.]|uniref:sigma-54 interaction domain-containing protein n=1 Tax=Archangium sp. TaxID=1872627 RepID=UPI002D6D796D|nr:sigma 54-interacting transcriptional regulator [Archangium sp.]HYO52046.1 sigma 54-interacting transcriptional regulator [Archangium sp.]